MQNKIRSLLEQKGLQISEKECEIITNRWKYAVMLKKNLHKATLNEANIALRFIPGGEKNIE